jgi:iron-sulfur cluster repair protein YtfE (RIC family)
MVALILVSTSTFLQASEKDKDTDYERQLKRNRVSESMSHWRKPAQELRLTTRSQAFQGMSPDEKRLFKLQILDTCLPAAEDLADSAAHLKNLVEKFDPSEAELENFRNYSSQQLAAIRGWAKAMRDNQDLDLIDGRSKVKKVSRTQAGTHPELLELVGELNSLSNRVKEVLLKEKKRIQYPIVQAGEVNIVSRIEPSLDSQLKEVDKLAKLVERSIESYQLP